MAKTETIKNKKQQVIHPITSIPAVEGLQEALDGKQETLVSGENIKKINGESILGNGNIVVSGSGGTITIDSELSETSENPVENKVITQALNQKQDTLESGTNIKTVNGESIIGSGNLHIQEGDPSAVKFSAQELTEGQKEQARRNIDAAALSDINNMEFVVTTVLPEASDETVGFIFLVGPDSHDNYARWFTQEDNGTYTWISLGSTQIDLSEYAKKTEVEELADRLNILASTRYYGTFINAELLPASASDVGYAYIGTCEPFAIYQFDGETWSDTGATISGTQGAPGIGFGSITTQQDGTAVITLTNGDTITLNLVHKHDDFYSKNIESELPSGGFLPDVVYNLGTLIENTTFSLAAAVPGRVNHYFWTFDTGETIPTVTWPANISWVDSAPTLSGSSHYEISILGGVAIYLEA